MSSSEEEELHDTVVSAALPDDPADEDYRSPSESRSPESHASSGVWLREDSPETRQAFDIVVPTLAGLASTADDYAAFPIDRVLKEELRNGELWFRVRFEDQRVDTVSFSELTALANGSRELQRFTTREHDLDNRSSDDEKPASSKASTRISNRRLATRVSHELSDSDSSEDEVSSTAGRRQIRRSSRHSSRLASLRLSATRDLSESEGEIPATRASTRLSSSSNQRELRKQRYTLLSNRLRAASNASEDELQMSETNPRRSTRSTRSTRSGGLKDFKMLEDSDDDIVISDLVDMGRIPGRRSSRIKAAGTSKKPRRRHNSESENSWSEEEHAHRRSGREKRQRINYREPGIDDDMAVADVPSTRKPRVIHSKEIFPLLKSDDEFVIAHNSTCDTCQRTGDDRNRGILIHCQGCSMSYHKDCIGSRGAQREHLVTKVSDENFVLQCRRCIGRPRLKDKLAPATDRCTDCGVQGRSSEPFKSLKPPKKPEISDGLRAVTPDTEVASHLLYNAKNVLFRCSNCFRAWHYNHLPARDSPSDADGSLFDQRVEQYGQDFKCLQCLSYPLKVRNIVTWRPADPESRTAEDEISLRDFNEDEREYLVRFEGQSYFHVEWFPGPWVWGAHQFMRTAFCRKNPDAIMTTEAAVSEEWLRVEICFDVEYDSFVASGKDVEIDLARINEVSRAQVKYRGLSYEDVVWEEPPKESDKERWEDWRVAYDDWVHGKYVYPARSTQKKISKARSTPFDQLERKEQPRYIKGPKGGSLMDYQMEGMNWLYYKWWKGENAILADEMGLGKTIQIIAFLACLFEEQKVWPFLIVVPHATVPNWKREIQLWAPGLRVVAYYGLESARKLQRKYEMFHPGSWDLKCHIVVTSYTCPIADSAVLKRVPWEGLIVDEGQRLKNDESLLYKSLESYKIRHKVLLTGTPLQNNPRELFNLLHFLDPGDVNASELEEEFGELTQENVPRLHDLIRPYFLRRTKAQVLTNLPPMAEVIVPVSMTTLQKKLYKSILSKDASLIKAIMSRNDRVGPKDRAKLNNLLMQLRKCVCHPFLYNDDIEEVVDDPEVLHRNLVEAGSKLGLLDILLPKLRERGHRVLIFSQFLGMLDIIEDFLNGLGMLHHRIDGTVPTNLKQKAIDDFNAPGSPAFAFLLSTRAGGVGINLATADTVIIMDPDWNPHQDIQALSRAHRIGQKNKVLVFHLMTRDTVEERIMQMGKKKLSLDHLIIEKMQADGEEDDIDVESILKFGAKRLFEDDPNSEERTIRYDDESVSKLLDRTMIEQTRTTDSAGDSAVDNAFSFARVWANEKGALEETHDDSPGEDDEAPDFWDRVLREREEEARREAERAKEELGRGKRKRVVNYNMNDELEREEGSDTDFKTDPNETESDGDDTLPELDEALLAPKPEPQPNIPPFNAPVPLRAPPDISHNPFGNGFNPHNVIDLTYGDYPIIPQASNNSVKPLVPFPLGANLSVIPGPAHPSLSQVRASKAQRVKVPEVPEAPQYAKCHACHKRHAPGQCPLRKAGTEKCPLCKMAHYGTGPVCPLLKDPQEINKMMESLRESNEPKILVDGAKRYMRNRKKEVERSIKRKKQKERELELAAGGKEVPEELAAEAS